MSRLEIRQQPPALSSSDLAALLGQVARGDHRAFELVYAELAAPVYGLVRQVLRDPAQSEEVALGAVDRPGGEEFCRPLAWRDFFYQVTAAFPDIARKNCRPGAAWHDDGPALDAWRAGQTGIPIVDAGMRQLAAEGFMHNRARMITASFLTRNLGIDWRHGYAHFDSLLADGDVANNAGNWQWMAGTGHNTRPNRVLNPLRQAQRFDRAGQYVRRYVPELAGLDPAWIQAPWRLPPRMRPGYPGPLVELP